MLDFEGAPSMQYLTHSVEKWIQDEEKSRLIEAIYD